jgi:hypothetical protein
MEEHTIDGKHPLFCLVGGARLDVVRAIRDLDLQHERTHGPKNLKQRALIWLEDTLDEMERDFSFEAFLLGHHTRPNMPYILALVVLDEALI